MGRYMEQKVRRVVREMLDSWDQIVVRVRQNGKRTWMPLGEVADEKQAARVVIDLIKSAMDREPVE